MTDKPEKFYSLPAGGLVYLIQNTQTKNIKIGCTRGTAENRCKELQTGADALLKVVHVIDCDCIACDYFEKRLHAMFRINHVIGEWYSLCDEAIEWLSSIIQSSELYSQPQKIN